MGVALLDARVLGRFRVQALALALALVLGLGLGLGAAAGQGTAEVLMMNSFLSSEEGALQVVNPAHWVAGVAALIGAFHCETGNSSVIAEYASLASECPDLAFNFTGSDTRYSPSISIQTLVEQKGTDFVVGATRSATTVPLALVSGALDVAQTSFFSTSQELSSRSSFRRFTRTIPSDEETAAALCSLLSLYRLSHVGMLVVDDEYGSAYRDALVASCAALDIAVLHESFHDASQASLQSAMAKLEATRVNVVVVVAFTTGVRNMLHYAVERGLAAPGRLFVFSDAVSVGVLQALVAAEPALAETLSGQQLIFANAGQDDNPVFRRFADVWDAAPGDEALLEYVRARVPGGARFVLPEDLNASGAGNPNAGIGMAIDAAFFESSAAALAAVAPYAYDAVFAACRAMCRAPSLLGSDVYAAQFGAAFPAQGASGRIVFDADTGSRAAATINYELFSIAAAAAEGSAAADSVSASVIARWSGADWEEAAGGLVFPPGDTAAVPLTTAPIAEDRNTISVGARAFAYVVMTITEVFCLAMLAFTFANRRHRVIVKSQPTLLGACLVGVAVSTAAVFPLSVDDGMAAFSGSGFLSVSCNLWWGLWTVGNTLAYGALITKLYRIMKIFKNRKLRKIKVTNFDLYKKILLFLAGTAVLLSLWFALAPLEWEREVVARDPTYGVPLESLGRCTSASDIDEVPFQVLVILYNFLLLAVATGIGYRVRHVESSFQESVWLFTAVASMLQVYALGLPIVLAIDETETSVRLIVLAGIVSMNNFVLASLLMVPKIIAMQDKANMRSGSSADLTRGTTRDGTGHETFMSSKSRRSLRECRTSSAAAAAPTSAAALLVTLPDPKSPPTPMDNIKAQPAGASPTATSLSSSSTSLMTASSSALPLALAVAVATNNVNNGDGNGIANGNGNGSAAEMTPASHDVDHDAAQENGAHRANSISPNQAEGKPDGNKDDMAIA